MNLWKFAMEPLIIPNILYSLQFHPYPSLIAPLNFSAFYKAVTSFEFLQCGP